MPNWYDSLHNACEPPRKALTSSQGGNNVG